MKWAKRLFVGLIVLVLAVYIGVPLLIGTSWAKEKIRASISEETGRKVAIGSVSFGWFSGLSVKDVRVDQKPGDPAEDGPLFELGELDLKVGLGEVLSQNIDIEELTVKDPRIVVIRKKDGSFNFSDLMAKPGETPGGAPSGGDRPSGGPSGSEAPPPVTARMKISGGKVLFIDRMENTRVEAGAIQADALWEAGKLDIDMTCNLNGGQVRLLAAGNLAESPPKLDVREFTVDGSEFSTEMSQLGLFLPLMGDKPQKASGTLEFEIRDLRGVGLDADSLTRSLTANGNISVSGGLLASAPLDEIFGGLEKYGVSLDALTKQGLGGKGLSMDFFRSSFSVKDGKIHSEDMTLDAAGLEFRLSGWTRLDGKIKYEMQIGNLGEVLGAEGILKDVLKNGLLPVELKGWLSDPKVEFDLEDAAKDRLKKEIGDRLGEGLGGLLGGEKEKKK